MCPTPSRSDPKKGQVDVRTLVFVSADNINVSALLNTDLITSLDRPASSADPEAAFDC